MLSTVTLFARIIQKCTADGWLPDEAHHRVRMNIPHRYPPATEQQLLATEAALGFTLPTALRNLYTQVANGGFGPGFGILGTIGGFASTGLGGNIAEAYVALNANTTAVDHIHYQQERNNRVMFELPHTVWSRRLLPLCDWGCLITSFLDVDSEQILQGAPTSRTTYTLRVQADSLEAWLDGWLQGTLSC